ncbi:DNA-directed RNA polymerase subunit beta' [candidate division Kazan bacterium RBG_13_50_9]|uniref:DNA-directed RNA polymerase subunit beta' n=1 Tax=candidate division Kazan bacterium RBG_13_50_9 TaxID=1798535 RepID=A0A1F4NT21_UNCK3|nr:MAG: DNA-directed RNA polymerase subunit beta' [candidate division Kazan bacterium RBG_13_50_9]
MRKRPSAESFAAVRISLASPEQILAWSHGEVTKPETINYRTLKPEKDGLFDERIFGPTKDWECYCGKYKKVRYKGVVCDKCGVEVTRSVVRRERMGHIGLAVPVSHIWYLRGAPSRLALALDVQSKRLEQVIYFAAYIITEVDEEARKQALDQLASEYSQHTKALKNEYKTKTSDTKAQERTRLTKELSDKLDKLKAAYHTAITEIHDLKGHRIISELEYRDLSLKYGSVFKAGIGAEAVFGLVSHIDLVAQVKALRHELKEALGQKRKRLQKRLRLLEGLTKAHLRPEWMLVKNLPVIPPDLRPMVQLDGGRFATSDLNDLYRRVINRNNRLKKLQDIGAPEVITRNEKRMLQEAVDALFDLTAREASTSTTSKRKLKSLADLLRGKQGRFRQNLLGKRVDYSGRSVIVVGPTLNLYECGIPKGIALEIFKPFVISILVRNEVVHNVKTASKMVEKQVPEVWDALDEVIGKYYVLLNRAPTLHRLGIQAFKPVLVEGNAIQLHPLVCTAYNADFDGDQMAVHLPLSQPAQEEAREIMLSVRNLLKPATGDPIIVPGQDVVLGCYYMTLSKPIEDGLALPLFDDLQEALLAFDNGRINYHDPVRARVNGVIVTTTLGRLLFNQVIPPELGFINEVVTKQTLKRVINQVHARFGDETTAKFADDLKNTGFSFATSSGTTLSVGDLHIPDEKAEIVRVAEEKIEQIRQQYKDGLITVDERRRLSTKLWGEIKETIEDLVSKSDDLFSPVYMMIDSKARGSAEQLNQMVGMKGVVVNPAGVKIELPVKSNYKEGLTSLEYFISTHGARKGGADTALRTSDAGYLTRRLVDVAQDVVVAEEDCGTKQGRTVHLEDARAINETLSSTVRGRFLAEAVRDQKGGVLLKAGTFLDESNVSLLDEHGIKEVVVRSPLGCVARKGVCRKCYGTDLARGSLVKLGEAVGIVAAQSIGEPGTQLTMRTFHTGGVASALDITQGLPRVEELFEARTPKVEAILAERDGRVKLTEISGRKFLQLLAAVEHTVELPKGSGVTLKVQDGQEVKKGDVIAQDKDGLPIEATVSGTVVLSGSRPRIVYKKKEAFEYPITSNIFVRALDGQEVKKGERLTEGHYNLRDLLRLKGEPAVKRYIINEIQKIYALQGQNINDKHVEIIISKMFGRTRIKEEGDSHYMAGEVISRLRFQEEVEKLKTAGKTPPICENLLLGISKAALSTEGFLSAASFQETTRVLVEAATTGTVDYLTGLKENVIIGRLIPAGTGFRERAGAKTADTDEDTAE